MTDKELEAILEEMSRELDSIGPLDLGIDEEEMRKAFELPDLGDAFEVELSDTAFRLKNNRNNEG
jgi:hypothetical protein